MLPDSLKQNAAAAALDSKLGNAITGGKFEFNELTLDIAPAQIVSACATLKGAGWNRLSSLTCVDWHPRQKGRFEVVYLLQNTSNWERLRLKCAIDESTPEIDSVTSVWPGANWYEREVFDMFGITFRSHPGLKRILMPDDWVGHPLRKDYPVHGHKYSYKSE